MPKLIDLEKIKPIDFPSTEMDGLFDGLCKRCAYREDCEWPKLHPKIKLKECTDFNEGDQK